MPSKKVLSVIGGLSIDSIFNISQLPERGACVRSRKHKELGGRGTNIAIAAYRSLHNRPRTADGLLPIDDDDNIEDETTDDEDEIEVRIVGAIDNDDERKQQFTRLFRQNGVKTRGIQVFNDDVEKSAHTALSQRAYSEDLSIIDGTGRARQLFTPGVADKWEPEHFDRIEKLGGGVRPDLVVTTMELKREVVEKIIDTAHAAGVEIIVYGSPATQIVRGCFEKITHYICNEGDAAILLGYDKGDVYWDKWGQVTEDLMRMGVKNVVLTLGPAGVYYRNEQEHGYISGYRRLKQIEDSSGLTPAFAGVYAVAYMRQKDSDKWDLKSAAERGVKASALKILKLGSRESLPWAEEIKSFRETPLFESLQELLDVAASPRKGDRAFIFRRTVRFPEE